MRIAVLILNIIGLNWISRFITGHIGKGILVLLLDIFSLLLLPIGIGWIGIIIGLIIWIADLVKVCSGRWEYNGRCLTDWGGEKTSYNVVYNVNASSSDEIKPLFNREWTNTQLGQYKSSTICQKCGKTNSGGYRSCPYCGSSSLVNPAAYSRPQALVRNVTPEAVVKHDERQNNSVYTPDILVQENINKLIGKNWKDILLENNLEAYIPCFESNKLLDFDIIAELDENDLEKIGILIMGDRKKIVKLISDVKNFIDKH